MPFRYVSFPENITDEQICLGKVPTNMLDKDSEKELARREADETRESISDLDNISDTAIVGVTFLLAALGTWTSFVYDRLSDILILEITFIFFVLASAMCALIGVYYFARSLAPRQFYGEGVGDRFLEHPWLPFPKFIAQNDKAEISRFETEPDEVEDTEDLREKFRCWFKDYDPAFELETESGFDLSRFHNYKLVARYKARHTAYGMAYLRLSVLFFAFVLFVGLIGTFVS